MAQRRIILTGASGFVGTQLVPLLEAAGASVVLAGRDPARLAAAFPGRVVCAIGSMAEAGRGCDTLVHLAVANSDSTLPEAEIFAVNVGGTLAAAQAARAAGIGLFIHVSSVHALDPARMSAYARSKRAAVAALAEVEGLAVETVYLPPVYGARWSGKLALLNALPRPLAGLLFWPIRKLVPVVDVRRLAAHILEGAPRTLVLCDSPAMAARFALPEAPAAAP